MMLMMMTTVMMRVAFKAACADGTDNDNDDLLMMHIEDEWWLAADMRLQCFTPQWFGNAMYATAMELLYVAGLPLVPDHDDDDNCLCVQAILRLRSL